MSHLSTFYPPVLVSILLSIWMGHMTFEKDTIEWT